MTGMAAEAATQREHPVVGPDVDGVLFDLDGVVTDTASLHFEAWRETIDEVLGERAGESLRPFSLEEYLRYVDGKPRSDGLRDALRARGVALPEGSPGDPADAWTVRGVARRKDERYHDLLRSEGARVFASSVALVRRLQDEGYATAVFSSSRNAADVLASAGLADLFPVRVDGEDARRLGLPGKPAPDVLLEAARRVGVPPSRAMVVEDAEAGVQAARRGGFRHVVGVDRSGDGGRLRTAGADVVVADLSEVSVEPHVPPPALEHVGEVLAAAGDRRIAVFLDYDGTLTPIVARPELAVLDPSMRDVVRRLAAAVPVAVVSGRDRDAVRRLVGVPGVRCAGSHGLDVEGADVPVDREALAALDQAEAILRKRLAGVRGALVDRKRYTVAAHHRMVAASEVSRVEAAANEALGATSGLRWAEGKKVIELRPDVDWDKGTAVRRLVDAVGSPETVCPVYLGDDVTDEDAFRALRGLGVGVAVLDAPRATNARFLLRDPDEVRRFLECLVERLGP